MWGGLPGSVHAIQANGACLSGDMLGCGQDLDDAQHPRVSLAIIICGRKLAINPCPCSLGTGHPTSSTADCLAPCSALSTRPWGNGGALKRRQYCGSRPSCRHRARQQQRIAKAVRQKLWQRAREQQATCPVPHDGEPDAALKWIIPNSSHCIAKASSHKTARLQSQSTSWTIVPMRAAGYTSRTLWKSSGRYNDTAYLELPDQAPEEGKMCRCPVQ